MITLNVAVNSPRRVTLAGVELLVAALPLSQFGAIQAWILDRVERPKPIDEKLLDFDSMDPETAEFLRFARDLAISWPPKVGSHAWLTLLERVDGGRAKILWEAVRAHQEGFTEQNADKIVASCPSDQEWTRFLRTCLHGDPDYRPVKVRGQTTTLTVETDDWDALFGFLGMQRGWTPEQISALTFPQIRCLLDQVNRDSGKMRRPRTTPEQARAVLEAVKAGKYGGTNGNGKA